MAEYRGGFFLSRIDADLYPKLVELVVTYLNKMGQGTAGRGLRIRAVREAPVMLVSVTGGPSEGRARAFWHYDHDRLCGQLAEALECDCFTHGYETEFGWEAVIDHSPQPNRPSRAVTMDFDEVSEVVPSGSPSSSILGALPLGHLAMTLRVPRQVLDDLYSDEGDVFTTDLSPARDIAEFTRYLERIGNIERPIAAQGA